MLVWMNCEEAVERLFFNTLFLILFTTILCNLMLSKSAAIYTTGELNGSNTPLYVKIVFVEMSPVFSKHTHTRR